MGDDKVTTAMMVGSSSSITTSRDRELLIPVADSATVKPLPAVSTSHNTGRETFYKVIRSWASKKFMTGCVILFPIAVTFYITWWFIRLVDGFFSPIYAQLGISLGFVTSITFIFLVGIFTSSWLGASVLGIGEWFIKRMPFVRHIYNASKQISAAISPDQNTQAFKEVAIIRHPRIGEYAFGFITSWVTLQYIILYSINLLMYSGDMSYSGEEDLCCVYVPTNHLYIGDIFLVNSNDILRPNLSVREAIGQYFPAWLFLLLWYCFRLSIMSKNNLLVRILVCLFSYGYANNFMSLNAEIVVSGGMSVPQMLSTLEPRTIAVDRSRPRT
ncbi:hypothetical protein V2J09_002987 [Rumex salicifolius]